MGAKGRKRSFSEEQRQGVLELAAQGASQRQIAGEVFGDPRYRGRVERILAADARASTVSESPRYPAEACASGEEFHPRSDIELFRELVARAERALLRDEGGPSLAEIERLLRIKRQLDAVETVERLNAITRALEEP